jgi:hypothetical protein
MIIDQTLGKLLAEAKATIERIDFSKEEERFASLQASKAENSDAIAEIEKQLSTISKELREDNDHGGEGIADALLSGSGSPAETLAPSPDRLRERRASLIRGRTALNRRNSEVAREERQLRRDVDARMQKVLAPLVNELVRRQRKAAHELVDLHAAISAIALCDNGHVTERSRGHMALDGLMGQTKLLDAERHITIPTEIAESLAVLGTKGPLVRTLSVEKVHR